MRLQTSVGKIICPFIFTILFTFSTEAQIVGSFVDIRDKQTYETVTYTVTSSQQVITDHNEYGTYLKGEPQIFEVSFEDGMPSSITWMVQNLNFEIAGSRCKYDSDTNCESYGRLYTWEASKNACPSGWHLPSDDEWYLLAYLYDGVSNAGQHLKSTELGGTNKSLFNIKKPSIFWSSNEMDSESALDWKVNFRWVKLQRWKGGKNLYNSVRCVQDY
ncbi:FISUMP domain-containing protein [Ekhidna sp.]|uniref:FISUMP domain-containing protein n=1 Tax=Ekhidna sp. TaxID=2608089 RepID=UPI003299AA99